MKKTIFLLFFLVLTTTIFAQEEEENFTKKNSLGIQLGFNQTYWKDHNFAELNYSGSSFVAGLQYTRLTKQSRIFYADLNFSPTTLQTDASDFFDADRYLLNLRIGYLLPIQMSNEKLRLYLGGQYHTYLSMVFWDGTTSFSFYALHSLDVSSRLEYHFDEKQKLVFNLSLPLLGQLVRPPYIGSDKFLGENEDNIPKVITTGKFTSLNDFFGMTWDLGYYATLNERWDWNARFGVQFHSTKYLDESLIGDVAILLGANYKF